MNSSASKPSDRFIPYYIFAFFVVLAIVLAIFIYVAIHGYTGEVTSRDPYKEGLNYNHNLQEEKAQEQLGWKGDINFAHHGLEADIGFTLTDKNGKPVNNARVQAWFIRPTLAGHDKKITLIVDGKGHYSGKAALDLPGYWKIHVSATSDGHNFQQVKELNLQ